MRNARGALLASVVAGVVLTACGSSGPASSMASTTSTTSATGSPLQPAALGEGQCQAAALADGSGYGQVAIEGTQCPTVTAVAVAAPGAHGSTFTSDGYTCTATPQGTTSASASSWGGDYVSYSCSDGSGGQVAFDWGLDYIYGQAVTPGGSGSATLKPAALGLGECQATHLPGGSTYAQIALSSAACSTAADAAANAPSAQGADFTWNGFACTATSEGAGSPWSAAWSGTYTAYWCRDGAEQVAFTWGLHYTYA